MSKNLERDFSLKDWVTNRAANSLDPAAADTEAPPESPSLSQNFKEDAAMRNNNLKIERNDNQPADLPDMKLGARMAGMAPLPSVPASPAQQIQIVRLLRDLGDRLRASEKEREILWRELDSCRKLLTDIEDKADKAEKSYIAIEHKISMREPDRNPEQAEAFQKSIETKVTALETTTGSAILRLEDALTENSKLSRRLDSMAQDKARLSRKIETMEETLTQTQDSLKAKALVLLTDHALASRTGLPQTPALAGANPFRTPGETANINGAINPHTDADKNYPWWKKPTQMPMNAGTLTLLIALGLAGGWALSHLDGRNLQSFLPQKMPGVFSSVKSETDEAQARGGADQADIMNQIATLANQIEPGDIEAKGSTILSDENVEGLAASSEKSAIAAFKSEASAEPLVDRIEPDGKLPSLVKEIENKAFAGDAEAQHDLAAVYTAGHAGVKTNYERALAWFSEAAQNGVANAQYNLAVLYHQGLGVKQDTAKAISLYRVAAAGNHPEAEYNLGIAHIEGVGADYNPQLAALYFERAAAGGVVEAAYNLGLIQENGLLGESQPDEAVFWYKLAADHGSKQSVQALNQMTQQLGMKEEDVARIFERVSKTRPDALKVSEKPAEDGAQTPTSVQ